MANVLITGGTGIVGKQLSMILLNQGFEVSILSRSGNQDTFPGVNTCYWDPDRKEVDHKLIRKCEYIIHLAGANIGDKRWTRNRKQQIIRSRIESADLILQSIIGRDHKLKAYISASAIGYYGSVTTDMVFNEEDDSAEDFLGSTCKLWEQSADGFTDLGIRVVKVRTGVVFSDEGGVLPKLRIPVKATLGSAIGSGKQYIPWIHIEDLCNIYLRAIQDEDMQGAYNAVAPEHITNIELVRKFSETLGKPFWFPGIPSWIFRLAFGEMSVMLLNGSRISSDKIVRSGYRFQFPNTETALKDLYK